MIHDKKTRELLLHHEKKKGAKLTALEKEKILLMNKLENLNRSELRQRSVEVVNRIMKYHPNTYESICRGNLELKLIRQLLKQKTHVS